MVSSDISKTMCDLTEDFKRTCGHKQGARADERKKIMSEERRDIYCGAFLYSDFCSGSNPYRTCIYALWGIYTYCTRLPGVAGWDAPLNVDTIVAVPQNHNHRTITCLSQTPPLIASPVLPTSAPPFFPPVAVERALPELDVHGIMRFAHPPAELVSGAHPRRIAVLLEPGLKVARARPAWVYP